MKSKSEVPTPTQLNQDTLERRFYLALIGVVIAIGWLWPTRQSLWLDETGTYWIVRDGIREVFERSYYWSNFSPYFLTAWLAVHIGGPNEIVIRFPSIIAMCVATYFIYRIGTRLGDEETGLIAASAFVGVHTVSYAAADARPYAFTLMAMTGYVVALLRWLDKAKFRDAVAVVILAALTTYGHVLLSLGLVGPTLFALYRTTKRFRLILMLFLVGILLIPLVLQMRAFMTMGYVHTFAEVPALPDLFGAIAPPQLLAALILSFAIAYLIHSRVDSAWRPAKSVVLMLIIWMSLAPALFFLLGRTTSIQLFLTRYFMSTAPAAALLTACFIRSLEPKAMRRTMVGILAGISLITWVGSSAFRHGEDWRGAMAAARREAAEINTPLVMASCFVEAQTAKELNDERLKEVLFAPAVFYQPPGRVIHLPYIYDETYVAQIAEKELGDANGFMLLTCGENDFAHWLTSYAVKRQLHPEPVLNFRGLELRRFRRSVSQP